MFMELGCYKNHIPLFSRIVFLMAAPPRHALPCFRVLVSMIVSKVTASATTTTITTAVRCSRYVYHSKTTKKNVTTLSKTISAILRMSPPRVTLSCVRLLCILKTV